MNSTRMGLIAAACLMSCVAVTAGPEWRTREERALRQTLHFAGSGPHTLEVRTISGAISVQAWDGRDVEMIVSKTMSGETDDDLRDAERDVMLETTDNAAVLQAIVHDPRSPVCGERVDGWRGDGWRRPRYDVRFDFMIRVPRDTRLELCTINKGDVTVDGTRGDFDVRSVNGRVTLSELGGSGDASTVNGRVTASFVSTPRRSSSFKTINGDIVVSYPDGLAADLRMKTFNGGLFTDFEFQAVPASVSPLPERQDGRFVYRSNRFTTVRVGGGGPELTLDAFNGDVRVLRRSR